MMEGDGETEDRERTVRTEGGQEAGEGGEGEDRDKGDHRGAGDKQTENRRDRRGREMERTE